MSAQLPLRGQPLLAIALVLGGWIGARVVILHSAASETPPLALAAFRPAPCCAAVQPPAGSVITPPRVATEPGTDAAPHRARQAPEPTGPVRVEIQLAPVLGPPPRPEAAPPVPVPVPVAAGHQLLWMAALSRLPLPSEVAGMVPARMGRTPQPAPAFAPGPATRQTVSAPQRWSADGWLLLRRGGDQLAPGGMVPPTYGASQAGAVLRYRLGPGRAASPQVYLRATAAIASPHGSEVAAGLALRPLGKLPVTIMGEVRVAERSKHAILRPAVLAVAQLTRRPVPGGLDGEAYLQAGYVAGPQATAFVDGQARADRALARMGNSELRLGGAIWGGAQRGAGRLDAGPSATLGLPLGGSAAARLAMDWRFRLAGEAAPRSGPAITLSAGF